MRVGEWRSGEWVRAIIPDGTCTLYSVSCTLSVFLSISFAKIQHAEGDVRINEN